MRFTIKTKLGLAFGLILLLLAGSGVLSISSLGSSNDRMQNFAARPFSQVQRVLRFETTAVDSARLFARSLLEITDAGRTKLWSDFKANDAKFQAGLNEYTNLTAPEERGRIQPLRDAWTNLTEAVTKGMEFGLQNRTNHAKVLATGELLVAYNATAARLEDIRNRNELSAEDLRLVDNIELHILRMRSEIYRSVVVTDDSSLAMMNAEFQNYLKNLSRDIAKLSESARAGGFTDAAGAFVTAEKKWEPLAEKVFSTGIAAADTKALQIYLGPFTQARIALLDEVRKLRDYEESVAQGFVRDTQSACQTASERDPGSASNRAPCLSVAARP